MCIGLEFHNKAGLLRAQSGLWARFMGGEGIGIMLSWCAILSAISSLYRVDKFDVYDD